MITLSVVVPCFDVARHVADTLASLARNTAPTTEVIFVDDASRDDTAAVLGAGVQRLPGARVLTLSRTGGVGAARNAGLAQAVGDYVTFLDGDDVLAPGYLDQLVGSIEGLQCDFLRTDHVQVRGRDRVLRRVAHPHRGVVTDSRTGIGRAGQSSAVDAPNVWAGIYSRRLLDDGLLQFDEDLRTCEDRVWVWRLHLAGRPFAVVGLRGVRYRREVTGSLTDIRDERQLDFVPAFERIVAMVRADPEAERWLPKALRSYCAIACHHLVGEQHFAPELQVALRQRVLASFRSLPAQPLTDVLLGLDRGRRQLLEGLGVAA